MNNAWDAVVAGAGPAGAIAAYVLAQAGRRVLLVDDVNTGANKLGESLPGAARRILQDLGLLALVNGPPHITCYGNASAWGSSELVTTDFISDPYGLGWHLDRPRFDRDLRTAAQEAGVTYIQGQVGDILPMGDRWDLALINGQTTQKIAARWLIDATGRRAFVARSQGIKRQRDAPLVALYRWIEPEEHRPDTASNLDTRTVVESAPNGWWYTALLPNHTRVVVLHVDPEDAANILGTPGLWATYLDKTQHIRNHIPNCTSKNIKMTEFRGTDASGACLTAFAGKDWVAAGDAALSFDPLSSQGMLNALYTGMKSGQAVDAALDGGLSLIDAYTARLEEIRTTYLRHSVQFYQTEHRWPDRLFWSRRHTMTERLLKKSFSEKNG